MSVLLDIARGAAVANALLLLVLGYIWGGSYRRHGANHTLGLLVFTTFLFAQNLLWLALYGFDDAFIGWFLESSTDIQLSMTGLCGLQTLALVFLARITWR